jgi:hypothetical protein
MRRGFISMSRLLIVGVVIALVIAGCGGDWTSREGQSTTVFGPLPAKSTSPAQPADTLDLGRIQHEGTPPQVGNTCPTGYEIKGANVVRWAEQMYIMPGSSIYDSTTPVKCFASAEDAASAGYVPYQ